MGSVMDLSSQLPTNRRVFWCFICVPHSSLSMKMEGSFKLFQGLLLTSVILFVLIPRSACAERKELTRQSKQLLILCTVNGFMPYPGDATKYIQCVWIGPRWYYYVYKCPPGSGYDDSRKLCVFGVTNAPSTTTGASTTSSGTTPATPTTTASGTPTTTGSGSPTTTGSATPTTTGSGSETTPATTTASGSDTTPPTTTGSGSDTAPPTTTAPAP